MDNILVTGGCGFIASELTNQLGRKWFTYPCSLGRLVVIDKMDYCSRIENIEGAIRQHPNFKFIKGDINDHNLVAHILDEYKVNVVMHLAASTHVDISMYNSLQFTRDNILGTHALVETCRIYGKLRLFLHMSTDEVYGGVNSSQEHDESGYLNPTNPYSATKLSAEAILSSYGYSYKFPYIIMRGNNAYGHQQYPDKLIPRFTLLLHRGKKVPIHGEGTAIRGFIHVTDMCRAILTIFEKGQLHNIYNIGTVNEYSVMEITQKLCEILGRKVEEAVEYVPDRNFNDKRYLVKYNKLKALGWEEQISFQEGLEQTVQWYLNHEKLYPNV